LNVKIQLREKFIGFVDILGYSALTRMAENGRGFTLDELEELTQILGTDDDRRHFEKYGPSTCPMAPRLQKHLDFQIARAWDSVVVSAETSPAGVVNLVCHCFSVCTRLLMKGVMCRGYIKRGRIHHEGLRTFGSGHVDTVDMERKVSFYKQDAEERGTPFIEVDPEVMEYVADQPDTCVKEMFSRMVLTHEGLSAVFPIRRLSHSFLIGGFGRPPFDPAKERKNNQTLRQTLLDLKRRVSELVEGADERALRKSQHYLRALDRQLQVCDETDDAIERLTRPFGIRLNLPPR
jgi:hypothetical protein